MSRTEVGEVICPWGDEQQCVVVIADGEDGTAFVLWEDCTTSWLKLDNFYSEGKLWQDIDLIPKHW